MHLPCTCPASALHLPCISPGDHAGLRSFTLVAVTLLVIFPLSALREISALQYTSGGAIVIYFAFAVALLALAMGWASSAEELPPLK